MDKISTSSPDLSEKSDAWDGVLVVLCLRSRAGSAFDVVEHGTRP
ncbi:MAG: hypothetical protein NZ914_09190 [Gemmatales bacterium]|nr:hypothetical protein [Gemmatales bacterium]